MQINYFKELNINTFHFSEILWNNTFYIFKDNEKQNGSLMYLYDLVKKEEKLIYEFDSIITIIKVSSKGDYLILDDKKFIFLYCINENKIINIFHKKKINRNKKYDIRRIVISSSESESESKENKKETFNILEYKSPKYYSFDLSEKYLMILSDLNNIHSFKGYLLNIESNEITDFFIDIIEDIETKYCFYFEDQNILILYDGVDKFKIMDRKYKYNFKRINYDKIINLSFLEKDEEEEKKDESEEDEENIIKSKRNVNKYKVDICYQFNHQGPIKKIRNFNLISNELFSLNGLYLNENNLVFLDYTTNKKSYEIIYNNKDEYDVIIHPFIEFDYVGDNEKSISIDGKFLLKNELICRKVFLIDTPFNNEVLLEMWKNKDAYLVNSYQNPLPVNKFLVKTYSETIKTLLEALGDTNEIPINDNYNLEHIEDMFLDTFSGIIDTHFEIREYLLIKS